MRTIAIALGLLGLCACGGSDGEPSVETNAKSVVVAADRCAAVGWSSQPRGDGRVVCKPPVVRSAEECTEFGGTWRDATSSTPERCNLPTPDGGAPCNDRSDCAGDCEAGFGSHTCTPTTAKACNPVIDGAYTLKTCPY